MNKLVSWLIAGVVAVATYFVLQYVHSVLLNPETFTSSSLLFWIVLVVLTVFELGGGLWVLYRYVRQPDPKTAEQLAAEGIDTPPPPPGPRLPPLPRALAAGVALGATVNGSFLALSICFLSMFRPPHA